MQVMVNPWFLSQFFLKIKAGDEVIFSPKSKGHIPHSIYIPAGAKSWKGKISEEIKVNLDKEGVYIYECQNHGIMGMTGIIQVGKASNLNEAKDFF